MGETSVAEAKNPLPPLIDQAETGRHLPVTRRGKPLSVRLSEDEHVRLRQDHKRCYFCDLDLGICTTIMMSPKPSYKLGDVVLVLYPNCWVYETSHATPGS